MITLGYLCSSFFYRFQFCIEYLHLSIYLSHFPYFIYYINALFCNLCIKIPTSGLCMSPFSLDYQIFLPLCKFNIFLDYIYIYFFFSGSWSCIDHWVTLKSLKAEIWKWNLDNYHFSRYLSTISHGIRVKRPVGRKGWTSSTWPVIQLRHKLCSEAILDGGGV